MNPRIDSTQCGVRHFAGGRTMKQDLRFKHGMSNTRIYNIYMDMKKRCYNKKYKDYSYYGGRGIFIDSNWLKNFLNFYNWSMDNGYQDNLTIDRIDNDKGYNPNNCRWTNKSMQCINQRKRKETKYTGIYKRDYGYRAMIYYENKKVFDKTVKTEIEALYLRNNYIIENRLPHKVQKELS